MGRTSNAAKQEWNKKHYTTVKVAVKHETAAVFKSACADAGASMASVLGSFMEKYAGIALEGIPARINVKTLRNRRKAMAVVHTLIAEIRNAEEEYMNNMPENLQGSSRYDEADERLGQLDEAINIIGDIYA